MFYQVGLLPVTNNLLDISSDIYLIVHGMIRSDRLVIPGSCVHEHCSSLLLSSPGKNHVKWIEIFLSLEIWSCEWNNIGDS